jgi:uncharacterized protein (DUF3084 family)
MAEEQTQEQNEKSKGSIAYHEREAKRKALEQQVVDLTKEVEGLRKLKSVESDLKTVKLQLTKVESDLTTANGNLTKIKSENSSLTERLKSLSQGNESLKKVDTELNQVNQELNQVKSDFGNLIEEAKELKRINEDLNKDLAKLKDVETNLTKQAKGLNQQVADLTKVNADLTESNETLNWDSQELKKINEAKSKQNRLGMIALNTLMVFTALAASFANVIHLGERYLALIKDPTDLDRIVCYVSMSVFDLCIFFFAIYGKHILARIFAGAIMFIVFTKLATPFFQYGWQPEYVERFLVGMAFSGFLAFVSVVMSEVIAEKINKQTKPKQ